MQLELDQRLARIQNPGYEGPGSAQHTPLWMHSADFPINRIVIQPDTMATEVYKIKVAPNDPVCACDVFAAHTGLSKMRIKKTMNQGAAWLQPPGGKRRRIRRAKARVHPGDMLFLYYNESIVRLEPPKAHCIEDHAHYSIWYKPVGLTTQGSPLGDHWALSRQVETHFQPARQAFIVHRIDREASGLVVIAHHRRAAAALSELMRKGQTEKHYHISVRGDLSRSQAQDCIELPLDNREAKTCFHFLQYNAQTDQSQVRVRIETGRRHQIRRHFELIGFPVMGDPLYGSNNKNRAGLQLVACALEFTCPFENKRVSVEIDPDEIR
jgi:tRNA pseudouridine32 synthase/23S rRNA pseudouridine746 synthase